MAIADFNMSIDDHGFTDKPHGAHADGIAEFGKLEFQFGDFGVRIAVADRSQTCGPLAMNHASILVATEPNAEDRRLAGQTAFAEGH